MSGRGPHLHDRELFGPRWLPVLGRAVEELSWLLTRGYAPESATKLVGDRHALRERQRAGVRRVACSDEAYARRTGRRIALPELAGRPLLVDGFNCLITIESALAGGLVLKGRDLAHRDLASVHGSYRRVATTLAALADLRDTLIEARPARVRWLLDRPVSNSGELAASLRALAEAAGLPWTVELVDAPDDLLASTTDVVATADGAILDRASAWLDLAGEVLRRRVPQAWLLELAP